MKQTKKICSIIMALILSFSLAACGNESTPTDKEAQFVTMTFGDIIMSVPNIFGEIEDKEDFYVSAGPNSSIVVTKATEVDLLPSEWDESLAKDILEPMYGTTYTDMELVAFEGDVNMNGNTAIYFAFNGNNADGKERLVQIVRLYNADQTGLYMISLVHSAEDEFFTSEIGEQIINSITLEQ